MAPKPILNNPIVTQPVKAMGQWNKGMGYTKPLFLLPIPQRIEARVQTQKDSGSNPGKV